MNAESEMIASVLVSGENIHNGKQFLTLAERDGKQRPHRDPCYRARP
jgi:hypothetical protein